MPMLLVLAPAGAKAGAIASGAVCSAQPVSTNVSGPSTCSSDGAQASASAIYSAVGNTLTFSINESATLNGPSAFETFASVPTGYQILGPDRSVVVVTTFSPETYDVNSAPGTSGSFNYFVHVTAISTKLTGGAGQTVADVIYPGGVSTSEGLSSSFGLGGASLNGINGSITAGEVTGSFDFNEIIQVFEADGVTPAAIALTSSASSSVPEPSSCLLAVPALLALYFGRKRLSISKVN
jgi:hypothetical protein